MNPQVTGWTRRSATSCSSMWRRACRSHTQSPCYLRATLIEDVNDSDILWSPYIILWLCRQRGWGRIRPRRRASTGRFGWRKQRSRAEGGHTGVRVGAAAPGRTPCPNRRSALEKAFHGYAMNPGENVNSSVDLWLLLNVLMVG